MAEVTQGITKRLSFGELAQLNNNVDVEDVIKALRNEGHPTVESFRTALDLLHSGTEQRFSSIQAAAREQADVVGEADLRRLKRQFSSLKNTFLHYEVKDGFIAALCDGLPNGTEEAQLHQFEAEVGKSVEHLRGLKAGNAAAQQEIEGVIAQLVAAAAGFERQRAAVAADLAALDKELARHREQHGAPLPELGEGPGEGECQAALAAAEAEARELEAQIAQQLAEADELEAAASSEHEEAEALRAALGDLRARSAAVGEVVEVNARFMQTGHWCDEAAALMAALGGVSLIHVGQDTIHLRLSTSYPTAPVGGPAPAGAAAAGGHELEVALRPGGVVVCGAALSPADVDVAPVLAAAEAQGGRKVDFLVREVQCLLGGWLHRSALVAAAQAAFPSATPDAELSTVTAEVAPGVQARVRLVQSWPAGDDVAEVVEVTGAGVDAGKAAAVAGLRLPGRGLAAALEAAAREVA